jgi:hypothetical protein
LTTSLEQLLAIRDSGARRKVVAVLSRIRSCRGRAAAVSMHLIAEETEIATRDIQAIVKYLVEERHLPIGTAMNEPIGYFWITTDAERKAVRDHFIRRGVSTLRHAKAYDHEQLVGPIVGQLELAIGEEPKP